MVGFVFNGDEPVMEAAPRFLFCVAICKCSTKGMFQTCYVHMN
jgi:hypothetical protein